MDTQKITSYCEYAASLDETDLHRIYHDNFYGFSIDSDNELFGRLILEINQAGLSWTTILKKQESFRQAYLNYDILKVSQFKEENIETLMSNSGVIRNRKKIEATIYNANVILSLIKEHGTFKNWLDNHYPMIFPDWLKLFKKTFKFTGGEITKEFLMSTGYLEGAHIETCPIYNKISKLNSSIS